VSKFRASTHVAGAVAAVAALALGLFAASAVAWYGGEENGGNEETTPTGPTGPTGNEEVAPPSAPAAGPTQPASPPPVSTELLPAGPGPAAAVAPAPAVTPPTEVKGEVGTRTNERSQGTEESPVLAQTAEVVPVADTQPELARTGFDVLPVAILGAFALGGSALLFRRTRSC
jgi:hypothetical protein